MVFQELIDLANARLSGYQNAVDPQALDSFLNEGKDEVWAILKNLDKEYFMQKSQYTDAAAAHYFGPLQTNQREYDLPSDLRSIEFIECVTSGYENLAFVYQEINSETFKEVRRASLPAPSNVNQLSYLYTEVGKDQFVLAQFPAVSLQLVIWYIRDLSDYEPDGVVDDLIFPYVKKIVSFAIQRIMLSVQDPVQFQMWSAAWKEDIKNIAQGASDRNDADPLFVDDFVG